MQSHQFSRRTLLRGAGVSMALPWMESHRVWGDEQSSPSSSEAPVRLAVLFSGNGFHAGHWWAKGAGSQMELGPVLEPLTDYREKLLFIGGLYNEQALKGNIHSSQTGNLLSGAPLASGGEIRGGTSFDQVIAQQYGRSTKVPSLVLGCERSNPGIHKNYSMLYSSHISWSSPSTPTPLELYPALAFDRLFSDRTDRGEQSVLAAVLGEAQRFRRKVGRRDQQKLDEYLNSVREVEQRIDQAGQADRGEQSVLDAVLGEAQRFRRKVGRRDQQKLDEYLNSVREVEQRIEQAGQLGELQGWRPTLQDTNMQRPPEEIPQDLGEHMRLMCDIMVLAFQTDATRVCTLKLNNDHSYQRFPHLGVEVGSHELSHSDRGKQSPDWLKVNQSFLAQVGYIAGKLDAIQEGERTALDNSMIMMCSSMLSGIHDATKLPVVVVGGAGGQLETGRVLDYLEKPNRKMCSLYLSMLNKCGIHLAEFGDSKERLAEV